MSRAWGETLDLSVLSEGTGGLAHWHPTYGVIYDEGEVIKRGTYAPSAQRAVLINGLRLRVRPQGAMCMILLLDGEEKIERL